MRRNSNRYKRKNKKSYNCGGYALGTYDWFIPYQCRSLDNNLRKDIEEFFCESMSNAYAFCTNDYNIMAERCIKEMICYFNGRLREIKKVSDAKENERVIAFRFGAGDFHFMIKGRKGHQWHSKMGVSISIDTFSEEYVMSDPDWGDVYLSDTYLMAMSK